MEEKTDWSRRTFLGMSALGVLSLAACGDGPAAPPQVDVQVPKALLDQARRAASSRTPCVLRFLWLMLLWALPNSFLA